MKYILCFLALFFLAACSLPGTQTETTVSTDSASADTTALYQTDAISMSVPKTWAQTQTGSLPSPHHGVIVTAYTSPEVKYGFANNLLIMQDTLTNIVTSVKYSELNHLQTTKNYLEYTKLQELPLTFADDETSKVYVFEAKYNQTTPRMKFIQTARVCGTSVYILHFSLSLEKSPANYIDLMKTFICK